MPVQSPTLSRVALAFVPFLSASLAAHAQTEPTVHHRYHHHHYVAHGAVPAPAAQRPGEAIGSEPPQTNQMFKPYARPGEGDNDGLSRDPDDCNKGCIGGNPG
ncbi:MAG TPA: hypothetical protein VF886_15775 [Roseiarcus sp.]